MAKSPPRFTPIDTLAGVQPDSDYTAAATPHYVYSDKIRFQNGKPRKIGGYTQYNFNYEDEVEGIIRSVYSTIVNGRYYQLLGTAANLYSVIGGELVNVTPLLTTAEEIPDSLSTTYYTLSEDPLQATAGSVTITVAVDNADAYQSGDAIYLSGSTGFAGFTGTALNETHVVREVTDTTVSFNMPTQANATESGGGSSVLFRSGLVEVDYPSHGLDEGNRIAIADAADFGGITAGEVNMEFIVRSVTEDEIYIMTDGEPTSSATAGGGTGIEMFRQISDGDVDERNTIGFGAGMYGEGLYGTARESENLRSFPRIWHWDRYGETIVGTPGNQGGVYQWFADNNTAPALIENAPTEVNYTFVSDNIIVTFGADGVENRIFASDQNNITQWTSSSTNQVYDDDIEGAGRLISHCPVEDYNIIFTEHKTYTFRYIGLPFVWELSPVDESIGIIAPMARCSVNGVAFWMGLENFYMFRGGVAEVIPANSMKESTCLKYVYNDINWGQKSKFFAWYNRQYNEVWFHYCSENSMECDRVVAVNILDFTWTIHRFDRSAAEYPDIILRSPHLADASVLYQHEVGSDADTEPMPFEFLTNKRFLGKDNAKLMAVIPDSMQDGNIKVKIFGYRFPQSQDAIMIQPLNGDFTITPTTERIPIQGAGRYMQYRISGDELGQDYMMGAWMEELQGGPTE